MHPILDENPTARFLEELMIVCILFSKENIWIYSLEISL